MLARVLHKRKFELKENDECLLVANLNTANYLIKNRGVIKTISTSGWHSSKEAPLYKKVTLSGLSVYIPKQGYQCWNSPLVSTPTGRYNSKLRLRDPKNVASGFTVTEKGE